MSSSVRISSWCLDNRGISLSGEFYSINLLNKYDHVINCNSWSAPFIFPEYEFLKPQLKRMFPSFKISWFMFQRFALLGLVSRTRLKSFISRKLSWLIKIPLVLTIVMFKINFLRHFHGLLVLFRLGVVCSLWLTSVFVYNQKQC